MRLQSLGSLVSKTRSQLRLLSSDAETFGRNLMQFTNPALSEQRLVDVLNAVPMHIRVTDGSSPPRLHVLDAAWSRDGMTGGPNTVINLAFRVAKQGVPISLVSTVQPASVDAAWLQRHAEALTGLQGLPTVTVGTAADPARPLQVGPHDVFLATHWTTAQQLRDVLPRLAVQQFFYMLQEFEPGFYPWSSNFALAVETFSLDFWPIINEAILADYLLAQPFGRLADPVTRERAVIFEPAVEAALFYPPAAETPARPKRLLFYARPTNTRNMFGLGLMALRDAAADPAFADWEFLSIGSRGSVPDLDLGHGHRLRRAPWMDYRGYAEMLRSADLLLCPMLSPHTSYPVLEMAATGGIAVTNTFATKTQAVFAALSDNIIAEPPTLAGLASGLRQGAARVNASGVYASQLRTPSLHMARDWGSALNPAALQVATIFRKLSQSA